MNYLEWLYIGVLLIGCATLYIIVKLAQKRLLIIDKTENILSDTIISCMRIKNTYPEILWVFDDLDEKSRKYGIDISPDFSGYLE